ncbi:MULTISPECIES: universal stress protein [unclassified Caballeronia]|uniref:universal stress protein n=1 Tax=unclassified Caballeronia TaxID=2646786 RepID=UPI0028587C4C|nr:MULTISPECIES: universal stress protein [unclassified Caballeronia]MDR5841898.1 universal stress protein [Caballeronia sp. LZ031]
MYRHLLVPVEDTDTSIEAIGQATEFAQAIGARITFLYVSPAVLPGPADEHAAQLLARAEAGARAQGVPSASVVAQSEQACDPALAQARRHGCDLIFAAASRPAMAAPVAGTPDASRPAMLTCGSDARPAVQASIGVLLGAHRALAEALHEWLDAIRAERERGGVPQAGTLREAVDRLHSLAARGFGANAKESLFRRLRKRTSVVNAELDELERLHLRDEELLDGLAGMIGRNPHAASTADALEQAVSAYVRFVSEWMGREQGVILPAARRYLSYADWTEINDEFNCAAPAGPAASNRYSISEPDGSHA